MSQKIKIIRALKSTLELIICFSIILLIIVAIYYCCDSPFEKLLIGLTGLYILTMLVPILISFEIKFLSNCLKISKKEHTTINTSLQIKTNKIVNNEGYSKFNSLFKSAVKNKLIDRNTILTIKYKLMSILGSHYDDIYSKFDFKNDVHCIYVLSKSSILTKDDYIELCNFINNNLILPK